MSLHVNVGTTGHVDYKETTLRTSTLEERIWRKPRAFKTPSRALAAESGIGMQSAMEASCHASVACSGKIEQVNNMTRDARGRGFTILMISATDLPMQLTWKITRFIHECDHGRDQEGAALELLLRVYERLSCKSQADESLGSINLLEEWLPSVVERLRRVLPKLDMNSVSCRRLSVIQLLALAADDCQQNCDVHVGSCSTTLGRRSEHGELNDGRPRLAQGSNTEQVDTKATSERLVCKYFSITTLVAGRQEILCSGGFPPRRLREESISPLESRLLRLRHSEWSAGSAALLPATLSLKIPRKITWLEKWNHLGRRYLTQAAFVRTAFDCGPPPAWEPGRVTDFWERLGQGTVNHSNCSARRRKYALVYGLLRMRPEQYHRLFRDLNMGNAVNLIRDPAGITVKLWEAFESSYEMKNLRYVVDKQSCLAQNLARVHEVEICPDAFKMSSGFLVQTKNRSVIHLDPELPQFRRTWIICHELAHLTLRHLPNSSYLWDLTNLDKEGREFFECQERQAEALTELWLHMLNILIRLEERWPKLVVYCSRTGERRSLLGKAQIVGRTRQLIGRVADWPSLRSYASRKFDALSGLLGERGPEGGSPVWWKG